MLEGDLKDQNIKIYLGMPMYGGMLNENTLHGILFLNSSFCFFPMNAFTRIDTTNDIFICSN